MSVYARVVATADSVPDADRPVAADPGTSSLDAAVAAAADRSGLEGFGVGSADPFPETAAAIEDAKASGRSAGLRFTLTEPAATDVRVTFPWAVRLCVGAWSYVPDAGSPGPQAIGSGRVARFATTDHYDGLRHALGEIADVLIAAGYRAEILVDDNRLVDRAAAVRAGVGWWGKNTMVLSPRSGPWLLLGSVVTDAPLEVSQPMVRDCGTCAACLPACPTGALVAPGVLDARRCLAYWAQASGPIPLELREAMGDRIYGCDDCLEACPPGHRIVDSHSDLRTGRHDLVRLLATDNRSLLEHFTHFYVPKRHPRYLRRNVLVALGNVGGPSAIEVSAGYLGFPDPLLRGHAAWALGALGGSMARAALQRAMAEETESDVADEISNALAMV